VGQDDVTAASIDDGLESDESSYLADDELVRRAQRDKTAFGVLYERYRADIHAFILSRVRGNPELAQDLTSQVFTRALTALPRYESGSFRAWLYAIARNLVIDEYRRRKPTASLDLAGHVAIDQPGLDDQVIVADARAQLHSALNQLGDVQRQVVTLRLQGMTSGEIADRMGMGREAVKSAQYRAFAKLRDYLQDQ
jgi:RNA polymerase sigma-70 factor (ECF subfamily)